MVTIDIREEGPFMAAWDNFDDHCVNQSHDWSDADVDHNRYVDRFITGLKNYHATFDGMKQTVAFEREEDSIMFLLQWG